MTKNGFLSQEPESGIWCLGIGDTRPLTEDETEGVKERTPLISLN